MQAGESQVRDDLCRVDGCQPFNALELHEYPLLHDQIGSIAGLDELPFVDQRNDSFADGTQATEAQLVAHTLPVRRLQQARPQLPMHLDPRADDLAREGIPLCPRCLCGYALGSLREQPER